MNKLSLLKNLKFRKVYQRSSKKSLKIMLKNERGYYSCLLKSLDIKVRHN